MSAARTVDRLIQSVEDALDEWSFWTDRAAYLRHHGCAICGLIFVRQEAASVGLDVALALASDRRRGRAA